MIVIDSEFQSLIPPLSDDEYERLERSILAEGVRTPIVTWNGTIIDGHNRYNVCDEHGIECPQVEREFASRDEAKLYIIDNQLRRRNLPPAAIGDLKLEEKEIVARQAKERQGTRTDLTPNLGESPTNRHSGETLDQLAKDIPLGRESLRKLDVIKKKAKEGDPTAIREREALLSGEKKSIHGAYVAVVGKPKPRKPDETVTEDGRRICAMCGEPINDGESHPARPTVHKKCEQEYQHDWEKSRYRNSTIGDTSEVLTHDKAELRDSLLLVVQDMGDTLQATIGRYVTMGVSLSQSEKDRIVRALDALAKTVESIKE